MKVTILCSDAAHPVNAYISRWMATVKDGVAVELVRRKQEALGGDLLFLISCSELVSAADRARYRASLVLHASALPEGRGWSPHIWQLIGGAEGITLSLIEAADPVDSGPIWKHHYIPVPRHALWHEINDLLFEAEINLMAFAIENFDQIVPAPQSSSGSSYYRRRERRDSELDPHKTIAEQFDLIRVCDPQRFPAYFHHRGRRYVLTLEGQDDN
ncbi:hypothetical protein ACFB49_40650 [Sphingomonas sp. DBB INV C78]|uniref:hypothetical protein n=1 Tax=Sphingomonas sp. DBB INV C78 TaxID=3349434 RepID=UPI0036D36E44